MTPGSNKTLDRQAGQPAYHRHQGLKQTKMKGQAKAGTERQGVEDGTGGKSDSKGIHG